MEQHNKLFLNYINDHYTLLKNKYRKFCIEKQYSWNEDVFSDTILNCYNAITKKDSLMTQQHKELRTTSSEALSRTSREKSNTVGFQRET